MQKKFSVLVFSVVVYKRYNRFSEKSSIKISILCIKTPRKISLSLLSKFFFLSFLTCKFVKLCWKLKVHRNLRCGRNDSNCHYFLWGNACIQYTVMYLSENRVYFLRVQRVKSTNNGSLNSLSRSVGYYTFVNQNAKCTDFKSSKSVHLHSLKWDICCHVLWCSAFCAMCL